MAKTTKQKNKAWFSNIVGLGCLLVVASAVVIVFSSFFGDS